jgi:hypothetical protein
VILAGIQIIVLDRTNSFPGDKNSNNYQTAATKFHLDFFMQHQQQLVKKRRTSAINLSDNKINELRFQAQSILEDYKDRIVCDHPREQQEQQINNDLIFYNRIGKAGSSTLSNLFQRSVINRRQNVIDFDTSNEYMSSSGEKEFIQIIVGNPKFGWTKKNERQQQQPQKQHHLQFDKKFFFHHVFFLNFTKYGYPMPIYINMMRDSVSRYTSQFYFWKTLADIGPITTNTTIEECIHAASQEIHPLPVGCPPFNYQTSYLCGHEPMCSDPPTDESFLSAVKHTVQDYTLIGTLERLDDYKYQVATIFTEWLNEKSLNTTWTSKGTTKKSNANKHRKDVSSEEEIRALQRANIYDVLLYEIVDQISTIRLNKCRERRRGENQQQQ